MIYGSIEHQLIENPNDEKLLPWTVIGATHTKDMPAGAYSLTMIHLAARDVAHVVDILAEPEHSDLDPNVFILPGWHQDWTPYQTS